MRMKQPPGQIARLTTMGGLLGIKTATLVPRLSPITSALDDRLVVTVPHGFDTLSVTTRVARSVGLEMCGPWLEALPGEQLDLEVDAASVTAISDEAALPDGAPLEVRALGGELAALAFDGETWTYLVEQANEDRAAVDATVTRLDALAAELGVSPAQRRVAANLYDSLARATPCRLVLRVRDGVLEPGVGIEWDRVEWAPIQSMHGGFYPATGGVEKLARLARAADATSATVRLMLGRTDPPAMRFAFELV